MVLHLCRTGESLSLSTCPTDAILISYNLVQRVCTYELYFKRKRPSICIDCDCSSKIKMVDLTDKVAIVTGASQGIGAGIVRELLSLGMKVVGLARRKDLVEKLGENYEGRLFALETDLTREEDILAAFEWIKNNVGTIHVLINNAGTGFVAPFDEADIANIQTTVNLNLLALLSCTKKAIQIMKENKTDGTIININSVAGHSVTAIPSIATYTGTKFGVTGFTEFLRKELALSGSKIRITSLSPGLVDTPLAHESLVDHPHLNPEDIAAAVRYILTQSSHINIPELTIRPVGEVL